MVLLMGGGSFLSVVTVIGDLSSLIVATDSAPDATFARECVLLPEEL